MVYCAAIVFHMEYMTSFHFIFPDSRVFKMVISIWSYRPSLRRASSINDDFVLVSVERNSRITSENIAEGLKIVN